MSTITVTLEPSPNGNRVKAVPNPLSMPPGAVTFDLGGKALEVAFERVFDLSTPGAVLEPWGPFGPFDSLAIQAGNIVGTPGQILPENSRYLYKIVENGIALPWVNPVNDRINGGGIDIPPKPTGGGGAVPSVVPEK